MVRQNDEKQNDKHIFFTENLDIDKYFVLSPVKSVMTVSIIFKILIKCACIIFF